MSRTGLRDHFHRAWARGTRMLAASSFLLALGLPLVGVAQTPSPAGLWKTIDDHTGQPRGLVRVYQHDDRFFARIEQTFTPGDDKEVCRLCTDERKNQPIIGLVIMRNVSLEDGDYGGGDLLDPETGTVYQCELSLDGDGTRMVVRGFIGIPLLGRSQNWLRVE